MSDEYQHPAQKLSRAFMANQYAMNANDDLLISAPEYFKRDLKRKYKSFIDEFRKHENEFDMLFDQVEDQTVSVYDKMELFFNAGAKIPIYEMENAAAVLEAFLIDPKSIEGVVKKIFKYKTEQTTDPEFELNYINGGGFKLKKSKVKKYRSIIGGSLITTTDNQNIKVIEDFQTLTKIFPL